jgi:GTPase SAR1 family protein
MSRFVLDGGDDYNGDEALGSIAEGVQAMAVSDGNEEGKNADVAMEALKESSASSSCPAATRTSPVVVLVIGMAGAGKTTLMHRINLFMLERGMKGYYVNLDPAVRNVPFAANIDIRDTVNYKEVMKQYGLGPNGAILTSLNLFATRFDQVVGILERRAADIDYIFIDTPGQIEAFTWSAGGQIMTDLLGTSFPTTVLYITDTPRCSSTTTFMSNMLNSCSVLYKSRLPMVCVFNKCDVTPCEFAKEWMTDFEAYQESVDVDKEEYMGSLNRSLSLVMEEFYRNIRTVGVSAVTGDGILDLFQHIDDAAKEFRESYLPDLLRRTEERKKREQIRQEQDLARLQKDLDATKGDRVVVDVNHPGDESMATQFGGAPTTSGL